MNATALKEKASTKEIIALSPSGIKTFQACKARYVYENMILPKIETQRAKDVTKFGTLFHMIAEHEFNKDFIGALLFNEKRSLKRELEQYAEIIQKREYFALPAVIEQFLMVKVNDNFLLRGIPDRICYDDDKIIVVDYKTAAMPDPLKDKQQILAYAFMLFKLDGVNPDNIKLVLDYVKADEFYEFETSLKDLQVYEAYVRQLFIQIEILRDAFLLHGDIKKIPHTVGECTFCPQVGACIAYRAAVNPVPDPLSVDTTSTIDLTKELRETEKFKKIYEERGKSIKEALMLRDDAGDSDVRDLCSVIESKMTVFPAEAVLERICSAILRESIKEDKYRYLIDLSKATERLMDTISVFLPDNLSQQSIPKEYLEKLEDLKATMPRTKYLKLRK